MSNINFRSSTLLGVLVALGLAGYLGYSSGMKHGFYQGAEHGHYAQQRYASVKSMADSCYDWAKVYDAKKPGNTDHVEKSCDGMMRTAVSYLVE